jgi:hypothetical protein
MRERDEEVTHSFSLSQLPTPHFSLNTENDIKMK